MAHEEEPAGRATGQRTRKQRREAGGPRPEGQEGPLGPVGGELGFEAGFKGWRAEASGPGAGIQRGLPLSWQTEADWVLSPAHPL